MGNGKITKELKGLGLKVNEKEPSGETVSEVIKGIAEDYDGDQDTKYTGGNGIAITDEKVINADIKVLETSNITGLTTEQCESLNVGDVVVKLTSNQKHTYTVSYKEAGVGMCLTYVDASTSETVSYDYTGGQWVYNSTDITPLKNVVANPTLAGTEDDLTGLQVGEIKYKMPSVSSSLHCHFIDVEDDDNVHSFYFYQILPFDVLENLDLTANTLNDNTKEYLTNLFNLCDNSNGSFTILGSNNNSYSELRLYKNGNEFSIICQYDDGSGIEDYEFIYSISNGVVNAFVEAKHNNNVIDTSYIIVEKIF